MVLQTTFGKQPKSVAYEGFVHLPGGFLINVHFLWPDQANKAKMEFESATAGHGTAQVEVEGKQYGLTLTKCEVKDSQNAAFVIKASLAPDMDQGKLRVHSDGINLNNSFNFSTQSATSRYYSATNTTFEFNGQSLAWQGIVETNSGKVPLTLNLSCGDEAVYYDKPSRPRPDKPNMSLPFTLAVSPSNSRQAVAL